MLTTQQIKELRFALEKSENPLILFDDDPDGLCSYLVLKKSFNNCKGIPIKSYPDLNATYLRKVQEYSPDKIFVLDKPIVSQEFIDNVNVPIYWIDHHPPIKRQGVHYYNPKLNNPKDSRPVTYWCHLVTNDNLWIASIGCISDWFIPSFLKKFSQLYPDILPRLMPKEKIMSETGLGTLAKMFYFLLKGKTSDVNKNIAILSKIETPYELLNQSSPRGSFLYKYYLNINKEFIKTLNKALKEKIIDGDLIYYVYPTTKISFTPEIAAELFYKFKNKVIFIGREKDDNVRFSMRSSKLVIPAILEKALVNLNGYGGGHDYACGGNISKDDLSKFIENLSKLVNKT